MIAEKRILIMRLFQIPEMGCYEGEQKYEEAERLIDTYLKSALKASYKEGIRDAINICDEAIENDFSGALRNRTWIRNKLQQLKEQK